MQIDFNTHLGKIVAQKLRHGCRQCVAGAEIVAQAQTLNGVVNAPLENAVAIQIAPAGLVGEGVVLATIEQRVRAVHLLYYLVTGLEMPEEPETPLLKLLCGLPLTFPLVKTLPLGEEERSEAERLLSAAIEHWDKLKNTSPAALRETFLQREGKLLQGGERWRLVVEQRSFDLLLGYLPWTLSVVRLPWMALPLWVDWA